MNLNVKAWISLGVLGVVMALLLFIPAGDARYWQAWVFLLVDMGASVLLTVYLMHRDPALLQRRLRGGPSAEKRATQKVVMLGLSVAFVALLVVPALDHRFEWSKVPFSLVIAGDFLVLIGFYLIFLVYRENTYSAATVEVAEGQHVISTGPYAVVRHPMYAGAVPFLVGVSLSLASYWGLVALGVIMPLLVWRLLDEEELLAKDLMGYTAYQQRVRYRLIPFVR